jgi:hypothetical protein
MIQEIDVLIHYSNQNCITLDKINTQLEQIFQTISIACNEKKLETCFGKNKFKGSKAKTSWEVSDQRNPRIFIRQVLS